MKRTHATRSRIGYHQLEEKNLLTTLSFSEFVDPNPNPGNQFGDTVVPLETGNVVITSPYDDAGGIDAGAVYLFNGSNGELISTLIGNSDNDRIGGDRITVLEHGNYLVSSPNWDNGSATDAGAITFGDGLTGVAGIVSETNSLVGSSPDDRIGSFGITELVNGNYVVRSPFWDNGSATDAGAVTFGNGATGVSGAVSAVNSLVGSSSDDRVGNVTVLENGNYVVHTRFWDNDSAIDVGAVTFGDGTTGVSGVIDVQNSLVGSVANDQVGQYVHALTNGNYVVRSPDWDNGLVVNVGAVTFGNGSVGITGTISEANSLVGSTANDNLGLAASQGGIHVLQNGNYIVRSPNWDNGQVTNAGAVTFGDGTVGVSGFVSATNSLVGSSTDDQIGDAVVTVLENNNFLVRSIHWDNGIATNAGAVTFGNGTTGVAGIVSAANSLVGSSGNDWVGDEDPILLENGNYLVPSSYWDNVGVLRARDAGAVTFGDGNFGVSGVISASNSLIGSTSTDRVGGLDRITVLKSGNYLVRSPFWNNGSAVDAGAVTFGNGTTGVVGVISPANSLVGSSTNDNIGDQNVTELENGNYLVKSPDWDNGSAVDAGAVTFGSGTTGIKGVIGSGNSLVGSSTGDGVGSVIELKSGNYVVITQYWDNGSAINAGAITFGNGSVGVTGAVNEQNSLVGSTSYDWVGDVTVLENGNYVVGSWQWQNSSGDRVGAATFGNGSTGVTGPISAANSLIGSSPDDEIGRAVVALKNGNYVVASPRWNNESVSDAGAVTFGYGSTGVFGFISAANSLVGSSHDDRIGERQVLALENGNYVVNSAGWNNAAGINVGAVTFGNGVLGVKGVVSEANSLVSQGVCSCKGMFVQVLGNSDYSVADPNWYNNTATNAGAVTFGDGTTGVTGQIGAANSLVGASTNDSIGSNGIILLESGNFLVISNYWDNGSLADAGAVTFGDVSKGGLVGEIDVSNSVFGQTVGGGFNSSILVDDASDNFFAAFPNDGNGRVYVGSQTTGFPVIPISEAPAIRDTKIDSGGTSAKPDQWHRLEMFFDHDVTISADALSLTNNSQGGVDVDLSNMVFDYDPDNFKATWTFDPANPLPAAFYTYSLDANSITANGLPMDGNSDGTSGDDFVAQHHVALPGDANLDGEVDVLNDAFTLVGNLGMSRQAQWADGDFGGNGSVSVLDDAFGLVSNLGRSIVPPEVRSLQRDGKTTENPFVLSRPDQIETLTVDFSVDVEVQSSDLILRNETTDLEVDLSDATFSYEAGTRQAQWDLTSLATPLPAGYYSVQIVADSVTEKADGQALLADYDDEFYVALPGDTNLDGRVDVLGDGFTLVSYLGQTEFASWARGDFNDDDRVDVLGDGFALVSNLGQSAIRDSVFAQLPM